MIDLSNSPKVNAIILLILGVGLIIGGCIGLKRGKINLIPLMFSKSLMYYKKVTKQKVEGEGARLWSAIFIGIGLILFSAGLFYLYYSNKQCGVQLIWDCF